MGKGVAAMVLTSFSQVGAHDQKGKVGKVQTEQT
jgi:hypothetical protein